MAFAPAGEGTITVVKEGTVASTAWRSRSQTHQSARTVTIDSKTQRLFTVAAKVLPQRERKSDRFVVLVLEAGR